MNNEDLVLHNKVQIVSMNIHPQVEANADFEDTLYQD